MTRTTLMTRTITVASRIVAGTGCDAAGDDQKGRSMAKSSKHEVAAKMAAYRKQCDHGHRKFSPDRWVELQCKHSDAVKEPWWKRIY